MLQGMECNYQFPWPSDRHVRRSAGTKDTPGQSSGRDKDFKKDSIDRRYAKKRMRWDRKRVARGSSLLQEKERIATSYLTSPSTYRTVISASSPILYSQTSFLHC